MKIIRIGLLFSLLLVMGINGNAQLVKKIKITELEKMISESKGPVIINFWATFCKPCIEEMPYFDSLALKYKAQGLSLIFISLDLQDDYPKQVEKFVAKRKVKSPVSWLDETDADYFIPKIDSKWSGSIPATLFVNKQKAYRKLVEDKLSPEQLEKEIRATL